MAAEILIPEDDLKVRTPIRAAAGDAPIDCGALRIDPDARRATLHGGDVDYPPPYREFDPLAFLAEHPGRTFTREQIRREVWRSSPN